MQCQRRLHVCLHSCLLMLVVVCTRQRAVRVKGGWSSSRYGNDRCWCCASQPFVQHLIHSDTLAVLPALTLATTWPATPSMQETASQTNDTSDAVVTKPSTGEGSVLASQMVINLEGLLGGSNTAADDDASQAARAAQLIHGVSKVAKILGGMLAATLLQDFISPLFFCTERCKYCVFLHAGPKKAQNHRSVPDSEWS